jgi:hypothetical protein
MEMDRIRKIFSTNVVIRADETLFQLTAIMMFSILTLDILILDESYPPALLVAKARRLRHETGNWALHARHEEWDVSLQELAHKYGARPFQMLATPICFLVALYAAFVYGILYLYVNILRITTRHSTNLFDSCLAAFPIAFEEVRGWNQIIGALPFLAILIGTLLAGAANIFNNTYYIKRYEANGCKPVPEARLPPMMVGSVVFAAGLFTFGWTSDKSIPWIA